MDKTNNHLHLLDRIKKLDVITIEKMSSETMRRVTDGFDESLIRNMLYIGKGNPEQRRIIKTVKNKYNEWNQSNNFLWIEEYPEFIEELQMDIECGLVVTVNGSFPESEAKPVKPIPETVQEADKTNEEKDKLISELKQEVANYKGEVEKYKNELKQYKKDQEITKQQSTDTDDKEGLRENVLTLEEEIADMEQRQGIDAPKAALLVRIACSKLGGLPTNRENAWPLINNLWGCGENIAKRRLRESVKESTVESLAKLFDEVSPKIAGIIRVEGKKIIEKQKNVK